MQKYLLKPEVNLRGKTRVKIPIKPEQKIPVKPEVNLRGKTNVKIPIKPEVNLLAQTRVIFIAQTRGKNSL